jgi:DNA-binding GntR family transcriptional regulator
MIGARGMRDGESIAVDVGSCDPVQSRYASQAGRSKTAAAYQALRAAIMEGEVPPGQRLVIDDIASRLGVSPIPVREALAKLQADGLVVIEPYIGARVTDLAAEAIDEIFHHLESLESYTTQLACKKATPEQLASIADELRQMDRVVDDPQQWSVRNADLHHLICDIADAPVAKVLLRQVLDHWYRLSHYYMRDVFAERVRSAQSDHWLLFDAMSSGDCEAVGRIIRRHNREAKAAYLDRAR